MVDILGSSGKLKNRLSECELDIKQIIINFRINEGILETINRSFYMDLGEKIMYNINTSEVRIRNV